MEESGVCELAHFSPITDESRGNSFKQFEYILSYISILSGY